MTESEIEEKATAKLKATLDRMTEIAMKLAPDNFAKVKEIVSEFKADGASDETIIDLVCYAMLHKTLKQQQQGLRAHAEDYLK